MQCQRCNRVMVSERFYGPGDPFWGWRCVLCGNISDPIILENRNQGANLVAKGKKEKGDTWAIFARKGKHSRTDQRGVSLR